MTDTAPQLPDTSTWRKLSPGEIIPAGAPYLATNGQDHIVHEKVRRDFEVPHTTSSAYYADLPAPGPDLSLIPEGRENARVLRINGVVVGPVWMDGERLQCPSLTPGIEGRAHLVSRRHLVESVEPVTILDDDEIAVPRIALRHLRYAKHSINLTPDQRPLQYAIDHVFDGLEGGWSSETGEQPDCVQVPHELVERAQAWLGTTEAGWAHSDLRGIVRDLAALGEDDR